MTSKERIRNILSRRTSDRVGYWTGKPTAEAAQNLCRHLGISNQNELGKILGDDLVHIAADAAWRHPDSRPMFDSLMGRRQVGTGNCGVFARCESIAQIEAFDWPDPRHLDFSGIEPALQAADRAGISAFGGMWSHFFHIVADLFGMENYFVKMYTHPEVVEAATDRLVNFFLTANRMCFDRMAGRLDAYFIGNDLGSQEDLLVSPELFRRFILPGLRALIGQAKSYGLRVVFHSCGAIHKIIPMLIDAGIDALNPLQAKAKGMDAATLSREYGNSIAFIGGVDTQQLLRHATPAQVKEEVRRLKDLFGKHYIVSPSHESVLPDIPIRNLMAMKEAAQEQ